MITVSIKLDGAKAFERALARIEKNVSKKIVRKAVRAAQAPVLKLAKANAGSIVGGQMGQTLAANLVLRAPRKQRRGGYTLMIRLKSESEGLDPSLIHTSKDGKRTFVPAAIEFGHGTNKQQAARPFLRPAADVKRKQTIAIVTKEIGRGIDLEMLKK